MSPNRREFLVRIVVSRFALQSSAAQAATPRSNIKAIAFDGFAILDPRPVFAAVDQLFPKRGAELSNLRRTKQFEYTWLRTLSHRYSDFRQVTSHALVFAAKTHQVELTPEKHVRLMQAYFNLQCWPDVPAALRSLKRSGVRIAFLSNLTAEMLQEGIRNSQLDSMFDHGLSTDRVKAHKPDPRVYGMGVEAFGLKAEQILFAAFAGWNAAGAKSFGYPTFWVNRQNQPAEELDVTVDGSGRTSEDLAAFLASHNG